MSNSTVGTVVIDVKADTAKLVSGMKKAENSVSKSVASMKKAVLSMAAAYAGFQSVNALSNIVDDTITATDEMGKLSKKLGTTAESLSKYHYAATFAGVSQRELNSGLSAMIRRINNFQRDGGGAAAKAMETLGISAEYARENMTSTDDAFKEILKRLEAMPDGYKKTAAAQDIFSKSASNLVNLTASDLKKVGEQAEKTNNVISTSVANLSANYVDNVTTISKRISGLEQQITFALLPSLVKATGATSDMFLEMSLGEDDVSSLNDASKKMMISMVHGIGFITDAWTGVEIVLKSVEEAFYFTAWGISKSFDIIITDTLNKTITSYNILSGLIGGDRLPLLENQTTQLNADKVNALSAEVKDLTSHILDGRNAADEWVKSFDKIKEESDTSKDTLIPTSYVADNMKESVDDISRGIFEDWSDQISKTLADGIQAGLDGTDFSDFAYSLTESIGNSMTQAGLNSISSTLTKSGTSWDDVNKGDWVTTAIGIVLMGITSAQKKSAIAEQNLSNSMDKLTAVNKELVQIGMGEGSKTNGLYGNLGELLNNLNSATSNLENFEPNLWQSANDKGAAGVTNSIKNFLDNAGVSVFDSALGTQATIQGYLDKYVRDWFGSDSETDDLQTEINKSKTALSEWSIAVSKSMDALVRYGEKFGSFYDKLTDTSYFSDEAGKTALNNVTSTFGMNITSLTKMLGQSFNISNIDELKAGLALGDQSKENLKAMETASKLFESISGSNFSAVNAIDMFDEIETAVDYQIKLNKELADSYKETNTAIESALKALDSAYIGDYSLLSMLQKTEYANNMSYSSISSGSNSAVDAAYLALKTAAKSATRDEDIAKEFNTYTRLLETKSKDATRSDIVTELKENRDVSKDIVDRLERLEQAQADTSRAVRDAS